MASAETRALWAFARHARTMATSPPGTPVRAVWPDSHGREEVRPLPALTDEERAEWARLSAEAEWQYRRHRTEEEDEESDP